MPSTPRDDSPAPATSSDGTSSDDSDSNNEFADTYSDGSAGGPAPRTLTKFVSHEQLTDGANSFSAEGFWLDKSAGHGSLSATEDWVRSTNGPESNDGRSTTETTFYSDTYTQGPSQMDRPEHKRRSWSDLAIVNDGAYAIDESRGGQNFAADKQRWVQTFASKLQATSYHRDRAEYIVEHMEMGPYKGARISSEIVILGILSLLIDADVTEMENRAVEREQMADLLDDLECGRPDLKQARRLLHQNDFGLLFPNR